MFLSYISLSFQSHRQVSVDAEVAAIRDRADLLFLLSRFDGKHQYGTRAKVKIKNQQHRI
jgi:hypothetical protein